MSILVKFSKNIDCSEKFRFFFENFEKFGFETNFRKKILNLVKLFRFFLEISKDYDFGKIFETIRFW